MFLGNNALFYNRPLQNYCEIVLCLCHSGPTTVYYPTRACVTTWQIDLCLTLRIVSFSHGN